MRPTLSLVRREFAAYFTNPTGYAALFGFLVLAGLLFNLALGLLTEEGPVGVEYPMQVLLGGAESPPWAQVAGVLFWGLFPAVTGMLTMRLLAEERGFALGDDVLAWLLAHFSRDLGRLIALLDRLDRHSLAEHKRITIPFVRRLVDAGDASR